MDATTRRGFLVTSTLGVGWFAGLGPTQAAGAEAVGDAVVSGSWPTQEPDLVREMVGVSHGNVARVKELLTLRPTLAKAAWDWGFGDWETALGAASHVGNREIAELLLAHGARPDLFSAAMLGQLDVVKALVAAAPGVQRTPGPHGISLLRHAQAGGEAARAVVAYLEALGDAEPLPETVPLSEEEAARFLGRYSFGSDPSQQIEVSWARGAVQFQREGTSARVLARRADGGFSPAGAPEVRIRFVEEAGRVVALEVLDPGVVVRARKRG